MKSSIDPYLKPAHALGLGMFLIPLLFPTSATTQPFVDTGNVIEGVYNGSSAWGDYDGDQDLDLLISGRSASGTQITKLYRNDAGTFVDSGVALLGVERSALAWGDYDGDSDLDILLTGFDGSTQVGKIYRNDAGTFVDVGATIPAAENSAVDWADMDGDGSLDVIMSGFDGTDEIGTISLNQPGGFVINNGIPAAFNGSLDAGDYNNDGVVEVLSTGFEGAARRTALNFFEPVYLDDMDASSAAFCDYDNDGFLDIALAGRLNSGFRFSEIYKGDGSIFYTDIVAGLTHVDNGSLDWGDYDNDGDSDLILTGDSGASKVSKIYRNDAGTFVDIGASLTGVWLSSTGWGDYDNDGDLDLFITGLPSTGPAITKIYRNDTAVSNSPPSAPVIVQAVYSGSDLTVTWNQAADSETPASGLSYNLRVGTFPGGDDIMSAMAAPSRLIPDYGNAQQSLQVELTIEPVKVYCSVQAIDPSFNHSPFSTEVQVVPELVKSSQVLARFFRSATALGDYDQDGDLDMVIAGDQNGARSTILYANDGFGSFIATGASLEPVFDPTLEWIDFDNDGDIDLFLMGDAASGAVSNLYRNDGGVFVQESTPFPGRSSGSADWADIDNDGDYDVLISGLGGNTAIYTNQGGSFTAAITSLPNVSSSAHDWGDYDGDGDKDLVLIGDESGTFVGEIYENTNGVFTPIGAGLPQLSDGDVLWGDTDNDGDLDLLVSGLTQTSPFRLSSVYRNDGNVFSHNQTLPALRASSFAWGDYDVDGDLDFAMTGLGPYTAVQQNSLPLFADVLVPFPHMTDSHVTWGDTDGDSDLDLIITGLGTSGAVTSIYENCYGPNTIPSTPTGLSASWNGNEVTFTWGAGSDADTPVAGLTYNLRVGTTPGGNEVMSAMVSPTTNQGATPSFGNVEHATSYTLNIPDAIYFWSVQTVDSGFGRSAFAAEEITSGTVGVESEIPRPRTVLRANAPNPLFNTTQVSWSLVTDSEVKIVIYDFAGKKIRTLVDGSFLEGEHSTTWDRRSTNGQEVPAGIYFYKLSTPKFEATKSMVVLGR